MDNTRDESLYIKVIESSTPKPTANLQSDGAIKPLTFGPTSRLTSEGTWFEVLLACFVELRKKSFFHLLLFFNVAASLHRSVFKNSVLRPPLLLVDIKESIYMCGTSKMSVKDLQSAESSTAQAKSTKHPDVLCFDQSKLENCLFSKKNHLKQNFFHY